MKKVIIILITSFFILFLTACNNQENKATKTTAPTNTDSSIKDPVPKTITKQEVARIALIQAKQFITDAQSNKELNLTEAQETYDKAQLNYDDGNFKEAQKLAVDVRQIVQELLILKRL